MLGRKKDKGAKAEAPKSSQGANEPEPEQRPEGLNRKLARLNKEAEMLAAAMEQQPKKP